MLTRMKKCSFLFVALMLLVGCSTPKEPEVIEPVRQELSFSVGGNEYTLPTLFTQFNENGWELEQEGDFEIPANSYLENVGIRQDKYYLLTTFYNDTDEAIPLSKAKIVHVQAQNRKINTHYKEDIPPNFVFKEVVHWDLPEDEAGTLFDQTAAFEENRVYRIYTYTFEDHQTLKLSYHIKEGVLKYIDLQDFNKGPQVN